MPTSSPLLPSLYALLYQIIDYAGLFPPANLSLEVAIRNYISYRATPESWMLSRFILPATKMGELSHLFENGLTWDGSLAFSVLGQGGTDRDTFLTGLDADVQAISNFRSVYCDRIQVDVYETRMPASELENVAQARNLIDDALPCLSGANLTPFLEAPFGIGWESRVQVFVQALAHSPSDSRAGFKLRTGGVAADAFPTPEQVAFALLICRDYHVPLKCTAGLHHPIRSYREEVGAKMHGFLNVFVAGVLAGQGLDEVEVRAVLEEEDSTGFEFSERFVGWRGKVATIEQVMKVREKEVFSFGCCSFEEPVDDLSNLGFGLIKS